MTAVKSRMGPTTWKPRYDLKFSTSMREMRPAAGIGGRASPESAGRVMLRR